MATSGVVSASSYETRKIIEAALRRCRILPQAITAAMLLDSQDALYRVLSAVQARITTLWTQDRQLMGIPIGQSGILLPLGTIDVTFATLRSAQRLAAAEVFSSAGGDAERVIDGDMSTSCEQITPNGEITIDHGGIVSVSTIGTALNADMNATIVLETSLDDITYTTRHAPGLLDWKSGELRWWELDPVVDARYVRMRGIGGEILDINDLYVGGHATETQLTRIGQDSYVRLPNFSQRGTPYQYWVDRQVDGAILRIWPTASLESRFYQIGLWRQRHIMDVGTLAQTIEVPQRWYEAIVAQLAYKLSLDIPDVDPSRVAVLQQDADREMSIICGEERDAAPSTIQANIACYTR